VTRNASEAAREHASAAGRSRLHELVLRLRAAPRALSVAAFLAWCALIYVISAQPGPDLGTGFRPLPAWFHNFLHAPEYAVFAWLFLWAIARKGAPLAAAPGRVALCVLAVLVFGASDEWHQSFTPGRDGSASDVLTDAAGGWAAAAFLRAIETGVPRARLARLAVLGVLACVLAAWIATFVPPTLPHLGWL
jgi:VanZ family protein